MWYASLVFPEGNVPQHPALVDTSENSESALWNSWHPGMGNCFCYQSPFNLVYSGV